MSGKRILYIEDNFDNRLLIKRVLEADGYSVVEAENGTKGLELALSIQPDLVLMDINLPDIDGYECTARLRKIAGGDTVPIVALTANAMEGDVQKALDAGCNGYIPKPIDVDNLPRQIEKYIKQDTPVAQPSSLPIQPRPASAPSPIPPQPSSVPNPSPIGTPNPQPASTPGLQPASTPNSNPQPIITPRPIQQPASTPSQNPQPASSPSPSSQPASTPTPLPQTPDIQGQGSQAQDTQPTKPQTQDSLAHGSKSPGSLSGV